MSYVPWPLVKKRREVRDLLATALHASDSPSARAEADVLLRSYDDLVDAGFYDLLRAIEKMCDDADGAWKQRELFSGGYGPEIYASRLRDLHAKFDPFSGEETE